MNNAQQLMEVKSSLHLNTLGAVYKGRPANGEGGGFEISDIPGRGEGGGLWKFGRPKISEKIEIPKFLRAL